MKTLIFAYNVKIAKYVTIISGSEIKPVYPYQQLKNNVCHEKDSGNRGHGRNKG